MEKIILKAVRTILRKKKIDTISSKILLQILKITPLTTIYHRQMLLEMVKMKKWDSIRETMNKRTPGFHLNLFRQIDLWNAYGAKIFGKSMAKKNEKSDK